MPETSTAEFYFIAAMMFLILVLCVVSVWVFFRTYRKEMREKEQRKALKQEAGRSSDTVKNG